MKTQISKIKNPIVCGRYAFEKMNRILLRNFCLIPRAETINGDNVQMLDSLPVVLDGQLDDSIMKIGEVFFMLKEQEGQ